MTLILGDFVFDPTDVSIADNTSEALRIYEGFASYIVIDTSNGSEKVIIGNTLNDPTVQLQGQVRIEDSLRSDFGNFPSGVATDALGWIQNSADSATFFSNAGAGIGTRIQSNSGNILSLENGSSVVRFSVANDGDTEVVSGDFDVTLGDVTIGAGDLSVLGDVEIFPADNLAMLRIKGLDSATSVLTNSMSGLELYRRNMNTTSSKYGRPIKWMSTDTSFTTENPKFLAAIMNRATELFGADTDGGTALDFFTTPNAPGATSLPILAMTLDQDGSLILPIGDLSVSAGEFYLSNGIMGINTASPDVTLTIVASATGGGDYKNISMARNETDSSTQRTGITSHHYLNAEQNSAMLLGFNDASNNKVWIGGGVSTFNSATEIRLFTGATNATVTGTARLLIDSSGDVDILTGDLTVTNSASPTVQVKNSDTTLAQDQETGSFEFYSSDTSGLGAGIVGGLRMYAENSVGSYHYMTLSTSGSSRDVEAVRINSTQDVDIVAGDLTVSAGDVFIDVGDLNVSNNGATDGGLITIENNTTSIALDATFGSIEFYSNDSSSNSVGVVGRIALKAGRVFDGATSDTYMSFHTNTGNAGTLAEGMRLDKDLELTVYGGVIALPEITTPTAVASEGRFYTKSDNKAYFQDGAGVEHELAYV